jgi:hypothetical protein
LLAIKISPPPAGDETTDQFCLSFWNIRASSLGKREPELAPESAKVSVYFHAGRRGKNHPYEQNNHRSDISQQIPVTELTESSAG